MNDALRIGAMRALDVHRLLVALGIEHEERRGRLHALCPNPKHDDQNPSWSIGANREISEDDQTWKRYGQHICWSCGWRGDAIDLVRARLGHRYPQAVRWLADLAGAEAVAAAAGDQSAIPRAVARKGASGRAAVDLPPDTVPLHDAQQGERWAEAAGIPMWQARRHGLLWDPRERRVLFPVYDHLGRLVDVEARRTDKRQRLKARGVAGGAKATPWPLPHFSPAGAAIVVEGFFEVMRLERLGYLDCAIAARTNRVLPELEEALAGVDRVVVLPDADDGGAVLWENARDVLRYKPGGGGRRVLRAALPCDGCVYLTSCKRDADDCREDEWILTAIDAAAAAGPVTAPPAEIDYRIPRRADKV